MNQVWHGSCILVFKQIILIMNIDKLRNLHQQIEHLKMKLYWELEDLEKQAEEGSQLERYLQDYIDNMEYVHPNRLSDNFIMTLIMESLKPE